MKVLLDAGVIFALFAIDWLRLEDLTTLDTALCSSFWRSLFLDSICNFVFRGFRREFVLEKRMCMWDIYALSYLKNSTSISAMNWQKSRSIKVNHILLTNVSVTHALATVKLDGLTSLCLSLATHADVVGVIPDESIESLIDQSPNLTSIDICQSERIMSQHSVLKFVERYDSRLTSLAIGSSSRLVISSIVEHQKSLTSLHISDSSVITDSDIEMVCLQCPTLTKLNISKNRRLTAKRSALAIVNRLVNLKNISFNQESNQTNAEFFRLLRKGFLRIILLDLRHRIATGVPLVSRTALTLNDVSREMTCSRHLGFGSDLFNLNDTESFMPSCNDVELVSMPRHVTGVVLDTFSWYCSYKIKVLNLQGSEDTGNFPLDPGNDLMDGSVFLLATRCKLLVSVNFSYRECITDLGMMALLSANPNLVNLFCVHCSNIGSGTILALSKHCHQLEILNVSSCCSFTDECFISLAEGCPELVHIGFENLDSISTVRITHLSMDAFIANCKGIQNVRRSAPAESFSVRKGGRFVLDPHADSVPELDPS